MYDCSTEILGYHDERVRLPQQAQEMLRSHRNANRERVVSGLEKNSKPAPTRFVIQGSYAMKTINQQPANDYDIDDGIVFSYEALKGPQGCDLSALGAREMVCEALQDPSFKRQPEVRTKCVRIYYSEGHNVDMPVYREIVDDFGATRFELAGPDWLPSDPEGVTQWFNEAVIAKSPDESNGRQMRRVVRLLKNFAKSRPSWKMPTGFVLSVLVDERYRSSSRDDQALYDTIASIHQRLAWNRLVRHPVVEEYLIADENDPCILELRTRLGWALEKLEVLHSVGCTRLKALKAWKEVFNTDYFDRDIEEEQEKEKAAATVLVSRVSTQPKPWCP
jgi:cyclic GMP-AMP synthase DncV-like protein